MKESNVVLKNENVVWYLPEWDGIIDNVAKVFRLNEIEKNRIYYSRTARIIASIPFAAECKQPERNAVAHICMYVAELYGFQEYCSHTPEDDSDIYNRLAFISTFEGGDKDVIEYGMNMLAMIMIEGYHKSEAKDAEAGIYNPFVSGAWNYLKIKNELTRKLNNFSNPLLDSCYYVDRGGSW